MYDLLLYVVGGNGENKYVPFIIIDLPGREEIVQTYVDRFLEKSHIRAQYNTPFDKSLLASMAINPLGISILTPSIIFDTFNSLDKKDRTKIVDTTQSDSMQSNSSSVIFKDEGFSYGNFTVNKLTKLYDFNDDNWNRNKQFEMISNYNYNKIYPGQENIIRLDVQVVNKRQIPTEINSIQYQGVLAFS